MKIKYLLPVVLLLVCANVSVAQQVEMADTMRSEGKIYVVVAVLALVMVGILGYLIYQDRKISNLEKQVGNKD